MKIDRDMWYYKFEYEFWKFLTTQDRNFLKPRPSFVGKLTVTFREMNAKKRHTQNFWKILYRKALTQILKGLVFLWIHFRLDKVLQKLQNFAL